MKAGAIVRLVIWLLVAAILGVLLIGVLIYKNVDLKSIVGFGGYRYGNAGDYTVGGGAISEEITELEIRWTAGSVTVKPYDGRQVMLEETEVKNTDYKLRYLVKDGKLTVQYQKSGFLFGKSAPAKDLTVSVPKAMAKKMQQIQISTVSADVSLTEICAQKQIEFSTVSGVLALTEVETAACALESVSGEIKLQNAAVERLSVETVSGRISGSGEIRVLTSESVSGSVNIRTEIPLERLDLETVSGSAQITMPAGNGFTATVSTVSGKFDTDFPVKNAGKIYTSGDGSGIYTMESVSGDLRILEAK